ncbi:hypothetical protein Tco_0863433 [Tanacetum coccineum]
MASIVASAVFSYCGDIILNLLRGGILVGGGGDIDDGADDDEGDGGSKNDGDGEREDGARTLFLGSELAVAHHPLSGPPLMNPRPRGLPWKTP